VAIDLLLSFRVASDWPAMIGGRHAGPTSRYSDGTGAARLRAKPERGLLGDITQIPT
jgi:hypothetical protein